MWCLPFLLPPRPANVILIELLQLLEFLLGRFRALLVARSSHSRDLLLAFVDAVL